MAVIDFTVNVSKIGQNPFIFYVPQGSAAAPGEDTEAGLSRREGGEWRQPQSKSKEIGYTFILIKMYGSGPNFCVDFI